MSRKLIIAIACAFAAQAQGDDDIWSQLRQSNQTDQITQAIADQGKEIVKAIEARNEQTRSTEPSITTEEMLAWEAKARAQAARDAARAAEPIPSAPLPTTPLEEYFKAKAALPAGFTLDQ